MELKIEIEIGLSESTKEFITELILNGARPVIIPEVKEPVIHSDLTVNQLAQAVAKEQPAARAEKKAAKASKPAEPVESPAEPEQPAEPAETAPVKEEPAVDYKKLRGEIKAYCSKRRTEGVAISAMVGEFLGKKGAKFSEIPDERLMEFKALVEKAEVA